MSVADRFCQDDFKLLVDKAKLEMSKIKNFSGVQIIVMLSSKGNLYSLLVTEICTMCEPDRDIKFLEELKSSEDTHIEKLVCMWSEDAFDLPSYVFRKKLCQINENNMNTKMLLQGEFSLIEKTIAETI